MKSNDTSKQCLINRDGHSTLLAKAWTAINSLSVIWKSDLTDKMKCSFFQAAVVSILLYGCTTWTLTKLMEKKLLHKQLHKNAASNIEQVLETAPQKAAAVCHIPPITKLIKIRRTRHAGHCWRSRDELISDVLQWTPFLPSKPVAGLGMIWNHYLLTMLTWNLRNSTPLSAAPRIPKGDQGWIFGL